MERLLDSDVLENGQKKNSAVELGNLTKTYGGGRVVDGLTLSIPRGTVYGILGPNGAGKTTLLKMLLGLTRISSGSARVLGEEPGTPESLSQVGALVESPNFYPYLSGLQNLKVVARYAGVPTFRAKEVVDQVGLLARSKDAVSKYSLGMKQRLGVAAALLKNPKLLILDEPTNGLDARGMVQMRSLIRRLGEEKRTVILSSHLMWEVEQLCDRVAVIDRGSLVAEGAVSELKRQSGLEIEASPVDKAQKVASKVGGVAQEDRRQAPALGRPGFGTKDSPEPGRRRY